MMKKQNNNIKLAIFWVISFICIIFMMSLRAFASEPYFPMQQNDNNIFTQGAIEYFNNYFDTDNNYVIINSGYVSGKYRFVYYVKYPKTDTISVFGEIKNNGYQFALYTLGNPTLICGRLAYNLNNNTTYVDTSYGTGITGFNDVNSSLYDTSVAYLSNFNLYTNNSDNRSLVLYYEPEQNPPLDIGTAIIPPNPFIPEYLTGDTAPQNVPPEYTINNYTWTTAPQFDGTSVINGIQSIKDTLDWLSSNLHEELANLLNNLKGLATYIGKTIQYYGNAIIETINNAIQNFYDNMKSLVEPIYTNFENFYNDFLAFADLFIHPFDAEEFEAQMESCELINQYEELMDNCEVIQQIFDYAEERDYFVLYIDFENPFADSEHKIIHSQISFNWLVPLRSVYRPFLWTFTLLECFVGSMRILGNIIGGKAK